MATVITVCNQKGGVAKTTTTVNLGAALARRGFRVLLVDNDPQGSLTISLGQEPDELRDTLASLMDKTVREEALAPGEGILRHSEGMDFIPANMDLSGLEVSLVNVISRETVLRRYIEQLDDQYDYILIDCNPSLGMLTLNALAAADRVLIPVEAQYLSARGMELLLKTIQMVHRQINRQLEIAGVLITKAQGGANHPKKVAQVIRETYGDHIPIYQTSIPLSVRAADASATGGSVLTYGPNSAVAKAYIEFALEFLGSKEDQHE